MATIKFTTALKRFFPTLDSVEVDTDSVSGAILQLEQHYQGITSYIVDENKTLRKHVNIFLDGKLIEDREKLSDPIQPNSEIYVMQALSGG